MPETKKDHAIENLLVAAAMAFLSLVVAGVVLLVQSTDVNRDRAALGELAGRPIAGRPVYVGDPAILRVYRVRGSGPQLFGATVALESRSGTVIAAVLIASDGELQAIKLMDANSTRSPFTRADWFTDYLGKGGDTAFPARVSAARNPSAVSSASESYLITSEVFGRLSNSVRTLAKEGK